MNIVTNYTATGHSGEYSTTSGLYTIAGELTTDAENDIVSLKGNITITSSNARVAAFNLYFLTDDNSVQDTLMTVLKTVRSAVDTDLNS